MKTDREDANALINMCYWSFVSNMFSYHTDCPQIETLRLLVETSSATIIGKSGEARRDSGESVKLEAKSYVVQVPP